MALVDMKMAGNSEGEAQAAISCTTKEKPHYPKIYLPVVKGLKPAKLEPGQMVRVTLVAEICSLTLRDEADWEGALGSVDLEVHKAEIASAGNEFSDLAEDE